MLPFHSVMRAGALLSLAACLSTAALAQQPTPPSPAPPAPAPQQPAPAAGQKPADPKAAPAKPPVKPGTPKPYKEVITAEAKSEKGMFTVHRIDERVYFEIPTAMYDRAMLWQTELAQTGSGFGYGGTHVGEKVICWERHINTIYMRAMTFQNRGDGKSAIQRAVDIANVPPIIMTFPVEAEGDNKSAVIDVTRLYAGDGAPVPGGSGADPSRSYLDRIKAFPNNIEARAVVTYNRGGAVTTTVHHSLILLPEKPMQGRYFDSRVGYFTDGYSDYGTNENR
ncbi:MAG TPA: DUF5117 domain-containing protein, partial [Chthonomonadaceae bacterium]|nr:DUF5117 domain-containing protein [Chthonomonadaceae bacterium]